MNSIWARTDEEDAAFRGDELRSSGLLDRLMAAGILRKCEDLNEVECDACGDVHLEGITWITEPPGAEARAYIWCPTAGRIRVERERLEVWRIDFDGLAKTISGLLGLPPPKVFVEGRLWLLGSAQFGDQTRDVFLACGTSWPKGRSLADHVRVTTSPRPVILVPNRLPDERAWRRNGRILLSMSEFDWFSTDWDNARRRIVAIVGEHDRLASVVEEALFRKDGETWTLSFKGRMIHIQDLVGLRYVAELLRQPGVAIEAATLAGANVQSTEIAQLSGMPMADETAIKTVRAEVTKKKNELASLQERDWTRKNALEGEISQLEKYLGQVETHRGHARKVAGTAQRSRTSVTNAINRAIDQISERHPDLGQHLKESIRTGTAPVYAPIELPDWDF